MFKILRHVFFESGTLLGNSDLGKNAGISEEQMQQKSFVSMNAQTKVSARPDKSQTFGEKLMALFSQVLELLSSNQPVMRECLLTMVNFASQNGKFKNAFLQAASSQVSTKRTSVLKMVVERLLVQRHG